MSLYLTNGNPLYLRSGSRLWERDGQDAVLQTRLDVLFLMSLVNVCKK